MCRIAVSIINEYTVNVSTLYTLHVLLITYIISARLITLLFKGMKVALVRTININFTIIILIFYAELRGVC